MVLGYFIILLIGNATVSVKFNAPPQNFRRPQRSLPPGVLLDLGGEGDGRLQLPPGAGGDLPGSPHHQLADVVVAALRLAQLHVAGDEHLPLGHRVSVLEHGPASAGVDVQDDAVGGGHHVRRSALVQQLRYLLCLPHHYFDSGAMEVDGHKGQLGQGNEGLVGQGGPIQGRSIGPRFDPQPL